MTSSPDAAETSSRSSSASVASTSARFSSLSSAQRIRALASTSPGIVCGWDPTATLPIERARRPMAQHLRALDDGARDLRARSFDA